MPLRLDPPVRVYLPSDRQPFWRVRSETQNRPRVRELELDSVDGEVLSDERFGSKPLVDRIVGIGVAAHEGQLFGAANQALGLLTAVGLLTLCVSAIVMWWRRRPDGKLGIPAPRVAEFRIGLPLGATIVLLANPAAAVRRVGADPLPDKWGQTPFARKWGLTPFPGAAITFSSVA